LGPHRHDYVLALPCRRHALALFHHRALDSPVENRHRWRCSGIYGGEEGFWRHGSATRCGRNRIPSTRPLQMMPVPRCLYTVAWAWEHKPQPSPR
jgi:hypothetical protein